MNWVEWIECCTSPTTRSRRTNNLEEWIGQTECRTIIIIAINVCDCAIRKLIICWVGRNCIAVQEDERKKNKEHSSPSSVEQIVGKMIIWKTISHQVESRPIRWMTGQKAKDANFLTQESGLVRTDDWLEKANFCATTLQNGLDWLGGWLGGLMEKELDVSIVFVFDIAKASGYSLLLTANWTVLDRWTPYFYVYCCTIASDCLFLTVQVEEMMRNGIDRRRDWILLAEEWRRTFTISPSLAYDSN